MKTSLVITTINKFNKNLRNFSIKCRQNNWFFIMIGDKKSPKNFKSSYGDYFDIKRQNKTKLNFAKICPLNNYARKNIGYLVSQQKKVNYIIETDDDNSPKKNYFKEIKLFHKVNTIKNNSWVNIYDLFIKNKKYKIWPRGYPLDELFVNKIKIDSKKKTKKFYLQQGVAEKNPDVDAIFRLVNSKIDVRFRNYKISLGNSKSPFNSQNTIWHKFLFELMYLPVTCTMRCTDIWRSLITLQILKINKLETLFFGTTMYQNRNFHNIMNDFNLEIPMYKNIKLISDSLEKIKLRKGNKNFAYNLRIIYRDLIKKDIFNKKELIYLNAWLKDCKQINKINSN